MSRINISALASRIIERKAREAEAITIVWWAYKLNALALAKRIRRFRARMGVVSDALVLDRYHGRRILQAVVAPRPHPSDAGAKPFVTNWPRIAGDRTPWQELNQ